MNGNGLTRRTVLATAGAAGLALTAGTTSAEDPPKAPRGEDAGSSKTGPVYSEQAQDAKKAEQAAAAPAGTIAYRHDWGNRRGRWVLRLNLAGVQASSKVFVSVGEGAAGGPNAGKFVGSARMTVHNVAPRNGGADIWVEIDWNSDLRVYADYFVVV